MRGKFLTQWIAFLTLSLFCGVASAQELGRVPGEFIIKFKTKGPHALNQSAEDIIKGRGSFSGAFSNQGESVDHLNQKFKIKGAKTLFTQAPIDSEDIEAVKGNFPLRTQRASQEAKFPDLHHVYIFKFDEKDPGSDRAEAAFQNMMRDYQDDPHVEYVQPNFLVKGQMAPNDPFYLSLGSWGQTYDDLWGLKKIAAEGAWDLTQGEGITVAVLDSGLDFQHPDIVDNIWTNVADPIGDIPDTCHTGKARNMFDPADDDCNGYIDDVNGWNFVANNNAPLDDNGHGTFAAGIIAATGNNNIGMIGVAPKAKVMVLKGLDENGSGNIAETAEAIIYAAKNGADVIQNGWSCFYYQCSFGLVVENAIQQAYGLGVISVFGAGNTNLDVRQWSPQNMAEVFTVSATDVDDVKSGFSNWGLLKIDFAAPGGDYGNAGANILSLKAAGTSMDNFTPSGGASVGTDYCRVAGSSWSAAYASGVAALILSYRPLFTVENVREAMQVSADDLGDPGFDPLYGAGRLNAARALSIASIPNLNITSPISGATYYAADSTAIPIAGTANGVPFSSYQLFYKELEGLDIWSPIALETFTAVENAELGSWDISSLTPDKSYLVKLVVTSMEGMKFEDTVLMNVDSKKPIVLSSPNFFDPNISLDTDLYHSPNVWKNRIIWLRSFTPGAVYFYDTLTNGPQEYIADAFGSLFDPLLIEKDHILYLRDLTIYDYDLSTKTEKPIYTYASLYERARTDRYTRISGNKVVFQAIPEGDDIELFLYDLSTSTKEQLTNDLINQKFLDISGNLIIWQENYRGIHVYDWTTKTQQVLPLVATLWPSIDEDKIVYTAIRNRQEDIFVYNLSTGTERQITNDMADQWRPQISGDHIVWEDNRNGNWDIYYYNLRSNEEKRVVTGLGNHMHPAISGGRVVWDYHYYGTVGVSDVFMLEFGVPTLNPIGNKVVTGGTLLDFTVSATDPDEDYLTFSAAPLPPGASFDPMTQNFLWATPKVKGTKTYTVKFMVADEHMLTDSETITITVNPPSGGGGRPRK